MSERLGALCFWLMFIGFNLAFFPMHISGLLGMPRRVYTYESGLGWDFFNLLSTIGAFVLALSVLVFIFDFLSAIRRGVPVGRNPWRSESLEWATASPPPPYNFSVIPLVRSRYPLWEPGAEMADQPAGVALPGRQALGTSVMDAEPRARIGIPGESLAPLVSAFGLTVLFFGLLADLTVVRMVVSGTGLVIASGALLVWLWPRMEMEP